MTWKKSSRSWDPKDLKCVEVCLDEELVGVRDSKNEGGAELWVSPKAWRMFVLGIKG